VKTNPTILMKTFFNSLLLAVVTIVAFSTSRAATVVLDVRADTSLFQPAPNNNLGSSTLSVGVTEAGLKTRSLLLFDIASLIPTGSVIQSASLTLYANREARIGGPELTSWQEGSGTGNQGAPAVAGTATWNNRAHAQTPWGIAGGQAGTDYSSTVSATASVNLLGPVTFASTAQFVNDVQFWLDNSSSNFGLFLIASDEVTNASARRFATTENTTQGQSPVPVLAPQLTVTYAAIPEPSSYALLIMGICWMVLTHVRRRQGAGLMRNHR
jgi:hypothetical protein